MSSIDTANKPNFLYQKVYKHLHETVRTMPAGEKIPPIRTLMNQFQVSQRTIEKALEALRQEGWLESYAGKGTFKTCPTKTKAALPTQIDFILFGDREELQTHGFHREFLEHFSTLLGIEEVGVRVNVIRHTESQRYIIETLDRLDPQAVVIWNLPERGIVDVLRENHTPYILISPNWPTPLKNSYYVDNAAVVRLWLDHLTELGHTKIAYLHGASEKIYIKVMHDRLHYIYEEFSRRGIICDPDLIRHIKFTPEEGYKVVTNWFDTGKEFTAIIVPDNIVSGVYRAIMEKGLEIGKDISVIGTDDLEWCSHLHPPLTSVRIPRKRIAERVINKLKQIYPSAEEFEREIIPVELKVRQSTGPVLTS